MQQLTVLIIGSGGREHALADAYSKSARVRTVFVAPGNDLMPTSSDKIRLLPDIKPLDLEKIVAFATKERIDLVDVAMDDPLAAGLIDMLHAAGIRAFGPKKKAAEIEWNKTWARNFMRKYSLPTPLYYSFSDPVKARVFIEKEPERLFFIKASGLAAGKGVIRAETKQQAHAAIESMRQFKDAGSTFLIEEGLIGEEFSLFAICDGKDYKILGVAQDHKTAYDSDEGPNTGGMGCISPTSLISSKTQKEVERAILGPFMTGMRKEGRPYTGILYLGGMVTDPSTGGGIRIIEFNARWGDPEAEVILPGIQSDYLDLISAAVDGELKNARLARDKRFRLSIAGCSKGYPGDYAAVTGKIINGLDAASRLPDIRLFGAGIKWAGKSYRASGGRIFHLTAEGDTIREAKNRAYTAMKAISIRGNNLHYRTDIGWRELAR